MIKLGKEASQFVYYAKGHFKGHRYNVEEVRIVVAKAWSGCEVEYVSDHAIVGVLTRVLEECKQLEQLLKFRNLEELVLGSFMFREKNTLTRFVEIALGILSTMQVRSKDDVLVELAPIMEDMFPPLPPTPFELLLESLRTGSVYSNGSYRLFKDKSSGSLRSDPFDGEGRESEIASYLMSNAGLIQALRNASDGAEGFKQVEELVGV